MTAVFFQFIRQVDNGDRAERAFLDTYAAARAQRFNYDRLLAFKSNCLYFRANNRAKTMTHFAAALRLASFCIQHCDPRHCRPDSETLATGSL